MEVLSAHLATLMRHRPAGVSLHIALAPSDVPPPRWRRLVFISADPAGMGGTGPEAWDTAPLRLVFQALWPGVVGVFAGPPMEHAYAALCYAAAAATKGAIIVQCDADRCAAWQSYADSFARGALRFDVAPAAWPLPLGAKGCAAQGAPH